MCVAIGAPRPGKTIQIAASAVMDSWSGHTVPLSNVLKMTCEMNHDFDLTTTGLCYENSSSHFFASELS